MSLSSPRAPPASSGQTPIADPASSHPPSASSLVATAIKAVLSPQYHRSRGLSWHEYVAYHALRLYQSRLSPLRIQNLTPSTAKSCARFARRHRLLHVVIELDHGAVAHRLAGKAHVASGAGAGAAPNVRHVVLFHGGGYTTPALGSHIDFAFGFANVPREDVAVYVLQYGLISDHANQYPRQLQQAVALIHHLLHTENIPASSIILLGDSAGAHLLLSLALHLGHPNPLVAKATAPPLLPFQDRFAGAVILSPWLSLHVPVQAMRESDMYDVLDKQSLANWAASFLGGAPSDPWNDPLTAPREWWAGLPFESILLLYGRDELLRNDGATLAGLLGECRHASVATVAVPGEVHDHMLMNRFLFLNKPCESEEVYKRWMEDHLGRRIDHVSVVTSSAGVKDSS
ncbi:hypothetical protein E4U21_003256 [Claviceps maximensis]|nr:hypothetical protein E4U21_003256 [Claviceps maximensis]